MESTKRKIMVGLIAAVLWLAFLGLVFDAAQKEIAQYQPITTYTPTPETAHIEFVFGQ